jgi:heme-degrading monooxygenase HmoA
MGNGIAIMYAVIFKAQIGKLDQAYHDNLKRMRELAENKYGCCEFISLTEGAREITISYWESLEQIQQWKCDAEHQQAQALGKSKWYKSYRIEVVEIIRQYGHTA